MTSAPRPCPADFANAMGIVASRSWQQARARILEAAEAGPATIAVLGAAGTGKTWLLSHLADIFRQQQRQVQLLRQGDLPWALTPGTVLLIDEASRLDPEALATLAVQQQTLVVLVDLPNFAAALVPLVPPPLIIPLLSLDPAEVAKFVAAWLHYAGHADDMVSADGVARLTLHSGGTPRLISRLLAAAFACGQASTLITGAEIDEVASMRLCGLEMEPTATKALLPPPWQPFDTKADLLQFRPTPTWRRGARVKVAAAAIALCATAASVAFTLRDDWARPTMRAEAAAVPVPPRATSSPIALALSVAPGEPRAASLPPVAERPAPISASIIPAEAAAPVTATSVQPEPAPMPLAAATAPLAQTDIAPVPVDQVGSEVATMVRPEVIAPSYAPAPEEAVQPLPADQAVANPRHPVDHAAPGLLLVARRGDTLRELYTQFYRGIQPPPYEDVAAANPGPLQPGQLVVFPPPPGGWRSR